LAHSGTAVIDGLMSGEYLVVETTTPGGYEASAPVGAVVGPDSSNQVQVVNQTAPLTLRVDTFETQTDIRIPGACYQLTFASDPGRSAVSACDADDGADDGVTTILVPSGEYLLY
jgi:uncharacterized surface anchored protein